jgi:hypothetical protein
VTAIISKLDPEQVYTHTGIMTKYNGSFSEPTDGFLEDSLRYVWPGSITATIEEAFGAPHDREEQGPDPW